MNTTLLLYENNSFKKINFAQTYYSYVWSFNLFCEVLKDVIIENFETDDIYYDDFKLVIKFSGIGTCTIKTEYIYSQYEYCMKSIITDNKNDVPKELIQHCNMNIYTTATQSIIASLEKLIIQSGGLYG